MAKSLEGNGTTNAVSEIREIFDSIRAIKGKDYAEILQSIYTNFNYHKMMTEMGDTFIPHEAGVRNTFAVVQLAHMAGLAESTRLLVRLHIQYKHPEGGWDEKIGEMLKDISDDMQTLSNKQDEYDMNIVGGNLG